MKIDLIELAEEKAKKLEQGKVWIQLSATEKAVLLTVEEVLRKFEERLDRLENRVRQMDKSDAA